MQIIKKLSSGRRHGWASRTVCVFFLAVMLFAQTVSVAAQSVNSKKKDDLTVKVVLFGPGSELYVWWGHIAIIVEDNVRGVSRMYDWGTFSFDAENFFTNFVMGRLWFQCSVTDVPDRVFDYYRQDNRSITIYTLDLSERAKEEIRNFAAFNSLPENKDYLYHHFDDNCATRIRDIIDTAVDGQLKKQFGEAPGRFTLRDQVRRHTHFNPFFDWFLNFLMGRTIDMPSTVWQEMFLPSEVTRGIEDFSYIDSNGNEKKLVTKKEIMYEEVGRPPVLEVPPKTSVHFIVFGLLLGCIFFALRITGKQKPLFRITFGTLVAVFGFLLGIMGALLFFMEFFSNHDYTYKNINVLFCNPLFFALIPFGIRIAKGKRDDKPENVEEAHRYLHFFMSYVSVAIIFTMILKCVPGFYQQNEVSYALMLPSALALSALPDLLQNAGAKIKKRLQKDA